MPKTRVNQHRWKDAVSPVVLSALESAAKELKLFWKSDNADRPSYPIASAFVFAELRDRIRNQPRSTKLPVPEPQREAKNLMDLFSEKAVRGVYEDQNAGSYKSALREAAAGGKQGLSMWRKILRSIDLAYAIRIDGMDAVPMPRVQFLHRQLHDIAGLLEEVDDMTNEGLAEFFDDLCPCGKKHRADTIRKLGNRIQAQRRQ